MISPAQPSSTGIYGNRFRAGGLLVCIAVTVTLAAACSQGAGEGAVKNVEGSKLIIRNCWNGSFSLEPTFFGANPFSLDVMAIRVQRGDDNQEVSDGLSVMINDVQTLRQLDHLGTPVQVGLPQGVTPPGIPLKLNDNPPQVSLSLYMNDSCHIQNGVIYSIGGTITFDHLFSGNLNETNSDERLTSAHFDDISFADPRDMHSDYTYSDDATSHIVGWFKFYFQRGQPAQPFP